MEIEDKIAEIEKKAKEATEKEGSTLDKDVASLVDGLRAKIKGEILADKLYEVLPLLAEGNDEIKQLLVDLNDSYSRTKTVIVQNIDDVPREVEVKNFPEQPKEIKISNPVKEVSIKNWPTWSFPVKEFVQGIVKALAGLPEAIAEKARNITQPVSIQNETLDVYILDPKTGVRIKPGGGSMVATAGAGSAGREPNVIVGQLKVAVTGTAVRLPAVAPTNGILITNNGTTKVTIGGSNVNNTTDGTGNGYILAVGATVSANPKNTDQLYINGTADTSYISYIIT